SVDSDTFRPCHTEVSKSSLLTTRSRLSIKKRRRSNTCGSTCCRLPPRRSSRRCRSTEQSSKMSSNLRARAARPRRMSTLGHSRRRKKSRPSQRKINAGSKQLPQSIGTLNRPGSRPGQGERRRGPMSVQAKTSTKHRPQGTIGKAAAFVFGLAAYLVFLVTFLYAIGFVSGFVVPKTIDSGMVDALGAAITINLSLMALFAVQHSVMARRRFKQWWTRYVPQPIERSTYVLFASLALILLFWQWRPIPAVVWQIADPQIAMAVVALSFFGWLLVLTSTFLINHFELFGLHQVVNNVIGRTMPAPLFNKPALYQF